MAVEVVSTGGCACGEVRYTLRGEPSKVGICHCTECRKETGSVFLAYADWPRQNFEVSGEFETYHGRSFCPRCGSRLFHLSDLHAEICVGSLDKAPSNLIPSQEGWIKRREEWLEPIPDASQHDEDP